MLHRAHHSVIFTIAQPSCFPINPRFPETRIIGLHFCRRLYGSTFVQICAMGSKRRVFAATECLQKTPPSRGTPANIPISPRFPETRIIGIHFFRRLYGSIFIRICAVGSKRRIFSAKKCILAVQGLSLIHI